ncbi:MAG: ATP-binding cassette domain-containing protein [Planctomycetaceae bacterium]
MSNPAAQFIHIRGARTHNLQHIDVDLPVGRLIVMTGVSGSGKSSLAFDTLFAEGQRRYLESVSVHTRTLLKQLPRPEVDEVSGLPPTVSVDQRVTLAPARSTLAVTTEIYDYLRLLYARAGVAHCTECGQAVTSQSIDQIADRILSLPERSKLMVLSPMVRSRKGTHKDVLERIGRNGFVRVRVNGELLDINDVPDLPAAKQHRIDAVIDRIILKEGIQQRLRESLELAVRESDGTCIVCEQVGDQWSDRLFSTKFSCPDCDLSFPTPEPRTFSFNSAWGACPVCEGFGIRGLAEDIDDITVFRQAACPECHGTRLQPFARAVTFQDTAIAELTAMSVSGALQTVLEWEERVRTSLQTEAAPVSDAASKTAMLVAERTLPDIRRRLECLQQVGLGYLELNRATRTLSGGEFQRARLAACLGTGLHGACFVLDEPTAGLHPRDTQRLLATLQQIRDSGATVIVVEHDGEIMKAADYLIDLGPGAGIEGGRLMFSGSPSDAMTESDSPTAQYLRRVSSFPTNGSFSDPNSVGPDLPRLTIQNARRNNLQHVTVDIPLQRLVCVTGVSGSGKSSLITETLLPIVKAHCLREGDVRSAAADADCDGISGLGHVQRVVAVDSSPLGRNRRSCIATFTPLWNDIRKLFAQTRDARARGFDARRFSFNSGDGRCSACKGTGIRDVRMSFLPDATVPCPECGGKRFQRATLAVKFSGRNVADILDMRVDEAAEFFAELQNVRSLLDTFRSVGLGYLTLGQPSSTFSGGESQRIKLATELATARRDTTLFILDEPTCGLHPADVDRLTDLLRNLVAAGHSVVVVEHNTDVMRQSDWLIDIGPESGSTGGRLVAAGTPIQIAAHPESLTGKFLRAESPELRVQS